MDNRDYYQILGISRDSSPEEIKAAYHDIARVLHPDSKFYHEIIEYSPSTDQINLFKAVTEAYNTLINAEKRLEYDRKLLPEAKESTTNSSWDKSSPEQNKYRRTQKTSAAYGTFGVAPTDKDDDKADELSNRNRRYSSSQPQFNKTAFGHSQEHEKISGVYKIDREQELLQLARERKKTLLVIVTGIGAFLVGITLVLVGIASKF